MDVLATDLANYLVEKGVSLDSSVRGWWGLIYA